MSDRDKGRILYIGRNTRAIEDLESNPEIILTVKENGLAAINWINNNIDSYDQLDAILCSLSIRG